jgi:hypothetical protein
MWSYPADMRAALSASLWLFALLVGCSQTHLEPVVIENGGDGAFYRTMPKEKEGCFWSRVVGGSDSFTDQLFLCCPQGAVIVDPVSGPTAASRPVCTKAVWGR